MVMADLPEVMRIEKEAFPLDAWDLEAYEEFLASENYGGTVACIDGKIVGYTIHEVHWNRVHLPGIAVDLRFRGRGIARLLVQNLISAMPSLSRRRLTLEVRTDNVAALALYKSFGFKRVRIKHGYYHDGSDAVYMALDLRGGPTRKR